LETASPAYNSTMHLPYGLLLIAVLSPLCPAAETTPVRVVDILNGRQISVEADIGGVAIPLPVTLRYLSLLEGDGGGPNGAAYQCLKRLLPQGSLVILQLDDKPAPFDRVNGIEAVICQDFLPTEAELAANPQILSQRSCLQIELIKAGVARYWVEGGAAPHPLDEILKNVERGVRKDKTTETPAQKK
jgi:hypothetical protein